MLRSFLVSVCVALALTACGPSAADVQATVAAAVEATSQQVVVSTSVAATQVAANACGAEALTAYADTAEKQMERFERQATLVGSTPRMSMGEPMQRLLDIQDETDQIDAPACLADYHERLVGMMGLYRLAYSTFSAQGDEATTQLSLTMGDDELKVLRDALTELRDGKVPTLPEVKTPSL